MAKIWKPRAGSGCCILSVSTSIGVEEKRRKYKISASEAYAKGVQMLIARAEGRDDSEEKEETIKHMTDNIARMQNLIRSLYRENELLKNIRGGR